MPKTLDRKRGYGEVWGHEGGARYEQDGVFFDANGHELVQAKAPAAPKANAQKAVAPKANTQKAAASEAASAVDDQVAAQLGEGNDFAD